MCQCPRESLFRLWKELHWLYRLIWKGLICLQGSITGKESTYQCRRHKRCGFYPLVEKMPWRRKWQPTPVFLAWKNPMDRGARWATVHRVSRSRTQLSADTHTHTHTHTHGLQYQVLLFMNLSHISTYSGHIWYCSIKFKFVCIQDLHIYGKLTYKYTLQGFVFAIVNGFFF